jgi:uncharacterized phage protein (TIGR02218 family)
MKDVSAAYIAKEEADQRKPVELYHIWRDGGEHWRYTDGDVSVTYDGNTYSPATLKRSVTKYETRLEVSTLQIEAPYVEDAVIDFIAINPVEILWISVMKLHRDQVPLEADVIFIGQIKDVSFKGISAKVNCVGFEYFLKQIIPVWRYQLTCNHMVFDTKCALVEASYKTTAVVTLDSTKTVLTSATFAGQIDGYFTGGKVMFGVESRAVVSHVGSVVTLIYKMAELEDNDSVDAYPGCDGRIETCRDKFNNVDNYLGFPFIPVENPAMRVTW